MTVLKRYAESLELFDRYLAIEEKLGASNDPEYATALADSARPLLALNRTKEALDRLERAVTLLPFEKGNVRRGANARFALAEALWAAKGDRTRARSLALEAAGKLKRGREFEKVEAWLGAHPLQ